VVTPKKVPGKERDYSEPVESRFGDRCLYDSETGCYRSGRLYWMRILFSFSRREYGLVLPDEKWVGRSTIIPQAKVDHFQGKSAERVKKRAGLNFIAPLSFLQKK